MLTSIKENDKFTCTLNGVGWVISQKILTEPFGGAKLSDSLAPKNR